MANDPEQRTIEIILKAQDANASLKEMAAGAAVMTAQLGRMAADDPGRGKLLNDLQLLNGRLVEQRTALRGTAQSAEELAAAQADLAKENMRVVVDGQKVNATFNEMKASASQLEKELNELNQDDPRRAKMLEDYKALGERIEHVKDEMGQAAPKANLFTQALGMAGVVVSVEAAVGVVGDMGKAIFETTSKFETYSAVMKNALGSESAAQLALHDIQTMAAKTPFSVDELTSSFIKFVNRGLKPSMEDMKKMADIAASQGKSFDQLTEAVLDAGTGEFERLKEFGIQASKNGDQVSLSFKGVQKTVANTPEAIQAALLGFGELNGVMGSTDAISKTLAGTTSNLGDTADSTALAWGEILKPAFVAVLSTMGFLLGILGVIPGFLVENRGALLALAGAVLTFNAPLIQANALLVYNAALSKGKVVWDWAVAASTKAWEIAQNGLNLALTANPIGAVIAVGTLLVGLLVMLWDKSEKFRGAVMGMGAALKAFATTYVQAIIEQLTGLSDIIMGIVTGDGDRFKKGFAEVGNSIKTMYWDAGKNAAKAFGEGYNQEAAKQDAEANKQYEQRRQEFAQRIKNALEKRAKQEAEAAEKGRLDALKSQEADLKVRLAGVEEGTRQELKLKQQLLAVQAKIELEDAKKSEDEKRVVRAEAQDKIQDLETAFNAKLAKQREEERKRLAKLAEDAAKKELAVEHTMQEARIAAIADVHLRELAENDLHINRKIEALQGSEEQITEQKILLEAARQQKITELQAKWAEEDAKKKTEEAEKQAELNAAADEEYAAYLENRVANGLKSEQDYQEALYNLKKQALEDQLALAVKMHGAEAAEAKRVRAEQLKLDTTHVKQQKALKEDLKEFDLKMKAALAGVLAEGLQLLEDNINKQNVLYGLVKSMRKTAALAEIGLNMQVELQNNAKQYADMPPVIGIPALALANGLTVARSVFAGIKVAAFAKGGPTDQLINQVPIDSLASVFNGGSVAPKGTFAGGGTITGPTIGLIGEAGAELVIPNWMYADPKQANLMGFLEAQIASKGNAFAAGGSTTGASAVASAGTDDMSGALLDVLERIAKGQQEFRDEITDWQDRLEVNLNLVQVDKGLKTVQQVKSGGGIR